MNTTACKDVSLFLKALSHPTRLLIVSELLKGTKCVTDMQQLVKARQANISQHLLILRTNGIVDWKQTGMRKCYYLKNPKLIKKILKEFDISKN